VNTYRESLRRDGPAVKAALRDGSKTCKEIAVSSGLTGVLGANECNINY